MYDDEADAVIGAHVRSLTGVRNGARKIYYLNFYPTGSTVNATIESGIGLPVRAKRFAQAFFSGIGLNI